MSALTKRYGSSPESAFDRDLRLINEANQNDQLEQFFNDVIDQSLTDEFWNLTLPNSLVAQTTQLTNWRIFQMALIHSKSHTWLEKINLLKT